MLVTHGRRDAIILPSMAEHVLAACPAAVASSYESHADGYMPFLEERHALRPRARGFAGAAVPQWFVR